MKNCYRCEKQLTDENCSREHILQNAIGGRLKSKKLLCRSCNSHYGSLFDNETANQLNFFANYLNIERDEGVPQNLEGVYSKSGESAIKRPDGTHAYQYPKIEFTSDVDGTVHLNLRVSNDKQLKEIIEGVKRKYPGWSYEEQWNYKIVPESEPISFMFKIGAQQQIKSATKSLINYFLHNGGNRKHIAHLLPQLESDVTLQHACMYLPQDWVYFPDNNEVSHVLKIVGSNKERVLFGYVEFFNVYDYVVILSETYDGDDIDLTYIYDILSHREVNAKISVNFSRQELLDYVATNNTKTNIHLQDRIDRFGKIATERDKLKQQNRIINEVVCEFLEKSSVGENLELEITKKINERISKELNEPWMQFHGVSEEAPPKNTKERNTFIFDKVKKWFK